MMTDRNDCSHRQAESLLAALDRALLAFRELAKARNTLTRAARRKARAYARVVPIGPDKEVERCR
jgi:hypothetical protein